LAGKVHPITSKSTELKTSHMGSVIQMPVKPTIGISFSSVNVEPPRLDHDKQ